MLPTKSNYSQTNFRVVLSLNVHGLWKLGIALFEGEISATQHLDYPAPGIKAKLKYRTMEGEKQN